MDIKSIFARADLRNLCIYLYDGTTDHLPDERTYNARLDTARDKSIKKLEEIFPNPMDLDEATDELISYIGEVQEVFSEIGLQLGLYIASQIHRNITLK